MSKIAAQNMRSEIMRLCGSRHYDVKVRFAEEVEAVGSPVFPRGYATLHVERNPFEMVISGYIYHRAGVEKWCNAPMWRKIIPGITPIMSRKSIHYISDSEYRWILRNITSSS